MKFLLACFFTLLLLPQFPLPIDHRGLGEEVAFMRGMIDQVNPGLLFEDETCAVRLPQAILKESERTHLDWRRMFTLAWQESNFDCHAKNRRDKGGAFGPFQIRPLWGSVTGDPRHRYYDPELAAARVARVLNYYRGTERFGQLVAQGFRHPLLCLYNSGEQLRVNMGYCRAVGRKMDIVNSGWRVFRRNNLVALQGAGRERLLTD